MLKEHLLDLARVDEVAAVGVPDPRLGERVCACVVPRPGEGLTLDELVLFLRDKIATYKIPEFLHLLDALPRTPTGKVQKGRLCDLVLKGMGSA
jgi:acyl-CoA synthetase (AMP-forming)/AMP-acid ligase II